MFDINLRAICVLELDRGEYALLAFVKVETSFALLGKSSVTFSEKASNGFCRGHQEGCCA